MGRLRRHPPRRSALAVLALLLPPLLVACPDAGHYVWINDLPPTVPQTSDYVIQEGDIVEIRVFNQEPLSTKARVRPDGRIAMPVIGDIDVRGKSPGQVKGELEPRLKDYVQAPSVTVTVLESHPITVSVLGEVAHPGNYPVDSRSTLAQVLALAGGLNDYASRDRLFLVRNGPPPLRVRFRYDDVVRGEAHTASFALQQGDLIVAE